MSQEPVSMVIISCNGRRTLPQTLESIKRLKRPVEQLILVDDASTDGSNELAKEIFPGIEVIRLERKSPNINRMRNLGLNQARCTKVMMMDNDIVLEPDALEQLLQAQGVLPEAAICTPRLMYADDPKRIYADGQRLHYLCTSIAENRNQLVNGARKTFEGTAGGGILLLDKTMFDGHRFYDEDYASGWGDDGELYRKATLRGLKCYHVPEAVAYHYAKDRTTQRAFHQVRNRWYLMLETYSTKTLILIAPALFLYEIFLFVLLCMKRVPGVYLAANWDVICHLKDILSKRRVIQKTRKIPDRHTLFSGAMYVSPALANHWVLRSGLKGLNTFFHLYWILVRRIL